MHLHSSATKKNLQSNTGNTLNLSAWTTSIHARLLNQVFKWLQLSEEKELLNGKTMASALKHMTELASILRMRAKSPKRIFAP